MKKYNITPFFVLSIIGILYSVYILCVLGRSEGWGLIAAIGLLILIFFIFSVDRILVNLLHKREFAYRILLIVESALILGFIISCFF